MFRSIFSISGLENVCKVLSRPAPLFTNHTRNTFVLRRKYPVPLQKPWNKPRLRGKYYVYDFVEFESVRPQPPMTIILTSYVTGIGDVGDKVTMGSIKAYYRFILPRLAVYDTPENEAKYTKQKQTERFVYSSQFVQNSLEYLSLKIVYIPMNPKVPWVLEPWHVRIGFRLIMYTLPESAITMPPGEIKGPDPNLENKEFFVIITINNKEKVHVRCRIYHWYEGYELNSEKKCDALFPEQAEILKESALPIQLI